MTVRVAVDFGTSSTCVVLSTQDRDPQVVAVDGSPLLSSAVFAASDGTLFVGQEAERQAAVDPSRYEPHPKRRIDEGELLLGDRVLTVVEVIHAVLHRAVSEARTVAGGAAVDLLVLTHPADWGAVRTRLLRQAANSLARDVHLVPEPVAAAVYHAATFSAEELNQHRTVEFASRHGESLAVLDLGGGTVDVTVVSRPPDESSGAAGTRQRGGFRALATRGDPSFGGSDIDQALLEHVGSLVSGTDPQAWSTLVAGRELSERRRRRVLRQDVRGSKETLSRHVYTDVPMPPPFSDAHVTREDLERLIADPLGRTVELSRGAVGDSGLRPAQLTAIFLVGGSSRIPMVSRLVHERLGIVPTTLDQPETVVARGALRAVYTEPDHRGPAPGGAPQPAGRTPGAATRPAQPPPRAPQPPAGHPHQRRAAPAQPPQAPPGQPAAPAPGTASTQRMQAPAGTPAGRGRRGVLWGSAAGVLVLIAALVAGSIVLFGSDDPPTATEGPQRTDKPVGVGKPKGTTYSQFHYSFVAPPGWTQSENNVAERQVVIKPDNAPNGDNLIVVQEIQLSYNGERNRDRVVQQMRADIAAQPPQAYRDFDPEARFAGKRVISYTRVKSDATVEWFVRLRGSAQVLVGCQYSGAKQRVMAACEQVVRTLRIRE